MLLASFAAKQLFHLLAQEILSLAELLVLPSSERQPDEEKLSADARWSILISAAAAVSPIPPEQIGAEIEETAAQVNVGRLKWRLCGLFTEDFKCGIKG